MTRVDVLGIRPDAAAIGKTVSGEEPTNSTGDTVNRPNAVDSDPDDFPADEFKRWQAEQLKTEAEKKNQETEREIILIPEVVTDNGWTYEFFQKPLGQGGQGIVYRAIATDPEGGRHDVAMKTLTPDAIKKLVSLRTAHKEKQEQAFLGETIEEDPELQQLNQMFDLWHEIDMLRALAKKIKATEQTGVSGHLGKHIAHVVGDGAIEVRYGKEDIQAIAIVTEFIQGKELNNLLEAWRSANYWESQVKEKLPEDEELYGLLVLKREELGNTYSGGYVIHLAQQIAEGLDIAHTSGIIHRDLKPANVMIDPDGEAYICDFGISSRKLALAEGPLPPTREIERPSTISRIRDHEQEASGQPSALAFSERPEDDSVVKETQVIAAPDVDDGTISGTYEYMSPEVYSGVPDSPARDLYALGMMMYMMRTGKTAFEDIHNSDSMNSLEKMRYHMENEPPPILSYEKSALDTLIMCMIAKTPEARKSFTYQGVPYDISSSAAVKDALQKISNLPQFSFKGVAFLRTAAELDELQDEARKKLNVKD